ncbi:MAG: hypothetical protein WC558_11835 [Patulibacter sp.]
MNAMTPVNDPRIATCASCGTPLASDQRYCLGCGARRDQARLPFQDALAPATVLPAAPAPPAGPPPALWYPPAQNGVSTPTVLAALACVLLAFGVGLLVGGGNDTPQQPVVIGGGVAPAAAPTAGTPTPEDAAATAAAEDAAAAAEDEQADAAADDAKAESTANEGVAAEDRAAAAEVEKTPAKVPDAKPLSESVEQGLNSDDPDKAREASQSLPDVVSTGD